MKYFSCLTALCLFIVSGCSLTPREKHAQSLQRGLDNPFLGLWAGFSPGTETVYNHSLTHSWRGQSDCQPNCPLVDVWQYQYQPDPNKALITDNKPIATRKEYWKVPFEARIIATTLFGNNPRYLDGFIDFMESTRVLKKYNNVTDPLWGYETFTYRVYVAKRNPANPNIQTEIKRATSQEFIDALLKMGCEIAYVDNNMPSVALDATSWRFMVAAEPMQPGERLRYLIRDVDWLVTGAEGVAIGEWINSGNEFHREDLFPTTLGPIKAGLWEGMHTGVSLFSELRNYVERYPYRLFYGDDEMFIRDMMWPVMKYHGSLMTHYYAPSIQTLLGNAYNDSAETPTQPYCTQMRKGSVCPDVILPPEISYPWHQLMSMSAQQAFKNASFFNMYPNTERGKLAIKGLSTQPLFQ